MSRGKYSPSLTREMIDNEDYSFNAYSEVPAPWSIEMRERGDTYDERIHFGNYDSDGYDSYGYSGFSRDGKYIGIGSGIDRWGYTEMDYLTMDYDEWEDIAYFGGAHHTLIRNR